MKKLIIIITCIAFIKAAKSQDLLVTKDSSHVQTLIVEVQSDNVKYKLAKNPEGPTYIIAKSNIAYINYKNGTSDRFANEKTANDLNKYNLDGSSTTCNNQYYRIPYHKKDFSHLYKGKNYIGFNHLALLNSNISLTYMRDLLKEKAILTIPVAVGIGKPDLTNGTYNGSYLNYGSTTTYKSMQFQAGAGLLFTPSFGQKVNFLIGPSFSVAQYDMSTKASYIITPATNSTTAVMGEFKNNFILTRQFYGGTIGFMFRMSEKLNMTVTTNLGCKKDTYNEEDPYGNEIIWSNYQWYHPTASNVKAYANLSWTIGYRF